MNKLLSCSFLLFCATHFVSLSLAQQQESLIGDYSDGSRAIPVHLIPLLDEEGIEISPQDELMIPFSTKQTCASECHRYETISQGWHFNASDPEIPPGRPGQPWIYANANTATQMPLSYRRWKGVYHPEEIGMSPWEFVKRFGRHLPGGGIGEKINRGDQMMRSMVSGFLEINCLACHDMDPAHDQAQYAVEIARENFRWAAAATSGFAYVEGSAQAMPDTFDYLMPEPPADPTIIPPQIQYKENIFNYKKKVFFPTQRRVLNQRCYFCHSTTPVEEGETGNWIHERDVHIAAGLQCVDCHRHGLDHNIVRGYEGESTYSENPLAEALSCEGCHVLDDSQPRAGRLGAPLPQHKGIPSVHFEKMTCTACHAGVWPGTQTIQVKTSMAHGLGLHNVNKSEQVLPHIISPILARNDQGKLAPHHALWPSFWGTQEKGSITPLPIDLIEKNVAPRITDYATASENGWKPLDKAILQEILQTLSNDDLVKNHPVYVSGGKVFSMQEEELQTMEHEAAEPFLWPIGHNVRPAAQSMGIRECEDCHSFEAGFHFAKVTVDTPLIEYQDETRSMISFQGLSEEYTKTFASTFLLRSWYKTILLILSGLLLLILVAYAARGLESLHQKIRETFNAHDKDE